MKHSLLFPVLVFISTALSAARAAESSPFQVTKVRVLARSGQEAKLEGARITGSNAGATTDFETLAKLSASTAGEWLEITLPPETKVYRFIKLETTRGSYGNIAELEFYSGPRRLNGTAFGTQGSRDNKGNVFARALDGDPATFFEGVTPNDQYVGLDLGADSQCAAPVPQPGSGSFAEAQRVVLTSGPYFIAGQAG